MSVHPLDKPVPDLTETEHLKSRAALRCGLLPIGSPLQIADILESWFRAGAADGFNVMPPFFPRQLDDFVGLMVPLLQERGLFRADYAGATLREHLGLRRPARPFTAAG